MLSCVDGSNGRDAFDILNTAATPALILLDIMMPIMDGREFLKLIRDDTALAPIPVVVISATVEANRVGGATSFIRKPFDLEAVLKIAHKHCHGRK